MAYEKYELDGEIYYLIKGMWTDSHFTRVSSVEKAKLDKIRMSKLDLGAMDISEIIEIAQNMKEDGDLIYAQKLFDEILKRSDDLRVIRNVFPRYTSVLRKLDKSRETIDLFEKNEYSYGKSIISPALLTSVAAAYCDTGDFIEARKKADYAMALSNGNASKELISVYARIKSLEKPGSSKGSR